ncbi:MAG: cupin domain-containing protein [Anaerofustis sp.]|jgi:quercetin dioxygenase-like cupin family protein
MQQVYQFARTAEKTIEKIIDDDHIAINHAILPSGEGLPEHFSNSEVYLVIVKGVMTLQLNDSDIRTHLHGEIVHVPYNSKMNLKNQEDDTLEFFIVKAPNPRFYEEK